MKNKILSLLSLSLFVFVILTSFASALTLSSSTSTLAQDNSTSVTLTVSGATDGDSISFAYVVEDSDGTVIPSSDISFVIPSITYNSITANSTSVAYKTDFAFAFEEEYTVTLTATDSTAGTTANTTLTFEKWYYDGENDGELEITNLEFDVTEGFGYEEDDKSYLYPFDEMEITFTVENGDYDMENIQIEACLFDETANKCIIDEGDMEISDDEFDIDKEDEQEVTIKFKIDPDDLESGNTDYSFYVKAVGDIDDEDYSGSQIESGDEDSETLKILNNEFVIVNNIEFEPSSISCGDTIEVTADVWNIDNEKLEDDEVYVLVYNKELGINQVIEFDDGIKALNSEELTFSFELPETIQAGDYVIKFTAYNDEDMDDSDIFQAGEDDDSESVFEATLKITEGTCSTTPTASVSASLESDAVAGKDVVVKVTVVNTGSSAKTFTLSASGYTAWASSATLDKTSVTLNAGASQDVLVTLTANDDASGENAFNFELIDGDNFLSQPISITVEKASIFNLTGFFASAGDNWYLWGIGALNVLLILVIVVVAVKVIRKK